jgi:hypothetical protein
MALNPGAEHKIPIGHGQVEVQVLDTISMEHLYENLAQAAGYSMQVGEDHIPEVDPRVIKFLFDDDYTI